MVGRHNTIKHKSAAVYSANEESQTTLIKWVGILYTANLILKKSIKYMYIRIYIYI